MTSDRTYDPQAITQYLLGTLSEAETERFDELSVADDEFADLVRAAEKDLVDAYVQGELTGAELEQFKAFYLASPLRREKVEFARTFHGWVEKNESAQAEEVTPRGRVKPRSASGWFSGMNASRTSPFGWQWSFAVIAILLLVAGGLLVFQNARLRRQVTQEQAQRDLLVQREQQLQQEIEAQRSANRPEQELARLRAERERLEQESKQLQAGTKPSPGEGGMVAMILAPPLRGANQVPAISIKPETNQVAAQLQLEAADYSAYRVALIDPTSNRTLWRSGKLKAKSTREGKALYLSFSAGLLKSPTIYLLRVAGTAANGAEEVISDYSFRVEK
jgi:cell division protein FtsB